MTTADLMSLLRSELFDNVEPYLWSDAELLTYLDDAQMRFCKDGVGITTVAAPYGQIKFLAGEQKALRNSAVLHVQEVLSPVDMTVESQINPFEQTVAGEARYLLTDVDDKYYYLDRPTDVALTVVAKVVRKAIWKMADGEEPEIDEDYHLGLLLWAKHKAFSKKDPETYDPEKADLNQQAFYRACVEAKREHALRNEPVRVVRYGGY